jgi:hypothetical protein
MPLIRIQLQFGNGRIVSEKITFENTFNHEVHEQKQRDREKPRPTMANQKHTDDHRQHGRDKLKPEMRDFARVDQTDALRDTAYN